MTTPGAAPDPDLPGAGSAGSGSLHGATAVGHDHHAEEPGPAEDPKWVVVALVAGLVIGLVVAVLLGLGSDVRAFV